MHAVIFGYLLEFHRSAGAIDDGYGGFEVGIGLAQDLSAGETDAIEEPEVIEEPEIAPEPQEEEIVPPEPIPETLPVITAPTEPTSRKVETTTPVKVAAPPISEPTQSRGSTSTGAGQTPTFGGEPGVTDIYIARLAARLNRFKFYPIKSLRKNEEGIAVLALVISRNGQVLASEIAVSSGYPELDRAALRMVNRAKPLPRFDRRMQMTQIRARIPITFAIAKHRGR